MRAVAQLIDGDIRLADPVRKPAGVDHLAEMVDVQSGRAAERELDIVTGIEAAGERADRAMVDTVPAFHDQTLRRCAVQFRRGYLLKNAVVGRSLPCGR